MKKKQHYHLDITAKMFACLMSSKRQPIFAVTAVLVEPVNPMVLKQALDQTIVRFPFFSVLLKPGFLWPSFESVSLSLQPKDDESLFLPFDLRGALFRVNYHDRKINGEFLHLLTDGQGGLIFMKTLLAQYFELQGIPVPTTHDIVNVAEEPDPEEYSDCLLQNSRSGFVNMERLARAYHLGGKSTPDKTELIMTGKIDACDVVRRAHDYQVSVTEYLSALLTHCILAEQRAVGSGQERPVVINVTADLRRLYPTRTFRNFSFYINLSSRLTSQDEPLDEMASRYRQQIRAMLSEDKMARSINETRFYVDLVRWIPWFLKKVLIFLIYLHIGERAFSIYLTNMGIVELPESIKDKVDYFETSGSNSSFVKLKCGVMSYNGILSVVFTSALASTRVQERFFAMLAQEGIPVKNIEIRQGKLHKPARDIILAAN